VYSSVFQVLLKSVQWFWSCGWSKIALPHYFGQWLIQQLVLPYKPWWKFLTLIPLINHDMAISSGNRTYFSLHIIYLNSWKKLHTKKSRNKARKNQMITLAIMGRSNPVWNLDQIWHECRYAWHNHVYNIWWLSFKGCKFGEGSKFSISHWLEVSVSHLEHRSHVWPCDATVVGVN